jgi:hypothetical protein
VVNASTYNTNGGVVVKSQNQKVIRLVVTLINGKAVHVELAIQEDAGVRAEEITTQGVRVGSTLYSPAAILSVTVEEVHNRQWNYIGGRFVDLASGDVHG